MTLLMCVDSKIAKCAPRGPTRYKLDVYLGNSTASSPQDKNSVSTRTRQDIAGDAHVLHLASVMRSKGVRVQNCRKNTGKAKFAFNTFARRMLPTPYKPPKSLASSNVET